MTVKATSTATQGTSCWCCGAVGDPDRMVHLGNHPEVAVCTRCAHSLHVWAGEIEDRSRTGAAARARQALRGVRRRVVRRGWHRAPIVGRLLRALGRRMP
jgi:hypothetical protein